jgi:hypothetical protein
VTPCDVGCNIYLTLGIGDGVDGADAMEADTGGWGAGDDIVGGELTLELGGRTWEAVAAALAAAMEPPRPPPTPPRDTETGDAAVMGAAATGAVAGATAGGQSVGRCRLTVLGLVF